MLGSLWYFRKAAAQDHKLQAQIQKLTVTGRRCSINTTGGAATTGASRSVLLLVAAELSVVSVSGGGLNRGRHRAQSRISIRFQKMKEGEGRRPESRPVSSRAREESERERRESEAEEQELDHEGCGQIIKGSAPSLLRGDFASPEGGA